MAARVRRIEPGEGILLRDVRLAALTDSPSAFFSSFAEEAARPLAEWEADAVARSAGSDDANFVAESGAGVVGLVGAYRSDAEPDTVQLVSMWVAPAARGQGIGEALVQCVVEWALGAGAQRVALWVMRENRPAIALYERAGFVVAALPEALTTHRCRNELRMARVIDT